MMRMVVHYAAAALIMWGLFSVPAAARDVNLDGIYIKKSSVYSTRLSDAKLDLYQAAGASFADSNVSFAGWSSGSRLIYVRETAADTQVVEYFPSSRSSRIIASIRGAAVYAQIPSGGSWAYIKMMVPGKDIVPDYVLCVVDLRSGTVQRYPSKHLFIDYAVSRYGESFVTEEGNVLTERFPATGRTLSLLNRAQYGSVARKDALLAGFPSPDARRILVLSGGGGNYDAAVFENGRKTFAVEGVSSAAELLWIDNQRLAYREGSPGHFTVKIFNCADGSAMSLGGPTMNTNISFSQYNNLLTFLSDGAVSFYHVRSGAQEIYPLEGEDVAFAPGGNIFCTLYGGRLFIVQREMMKSRSVELRRAAQKILGLYRELLKTPGDFENIYSREYIRRKIDLYAKLTDLK